MRRLKIVVAGMLSIAALPLHQTLMSRDAETYLNAALDIIQRQFLYRDKINWADLRSQTMSQAAAAQTAVDTYPAIRFALAKLGDQHSYLQLTPDLARQEAARQPKLADPRAMPPAITRKASFPYPSPFQARRVPEGAMVIAATHPIAQVVLPQFASPDRTEQDAYATTVQRIIGELATKGPCGWIVDLRGNGGGNVWAMRAGIGPLLGEGNHGATLHADGSRDIWFYESGKAGVRNDSTDPYYVKTSDAPVKLTGTPPVAVLIDRATGSSGEGVAIAFEGRPGTKLFGELTYGAASSTFPYPLSDGAQIYLVTGVMLDRTGRAYLAGVAPDIEVLSEATISSNDPVIRAASEWLSGLTACVGRL